MLRAYRVDNDKALEIFAMANMNIIEMKEIHITS